MVDPERKLTDETIVSDPTIETCQPRNVGPGIRGWFSGRKRVFSRSKVILEVQPEKAAKAGTSVSSFFAYLFEFVDNFFVTQLYYGDKTPNLCTLTGRNDSDLQGFDVVYAIILSITSLIISG